MSSSRLRNLRQSSHSFECLEARIAPAPVVSINLGTLNGTNGFTFEGANQYDRSGLSVSMAGDVNGDGFDDLIIGTPGADPGGRFSAGESYVIFGKATGFPTTLAPSALDGTNGFRIEGVLASNESGSAVSAAGDLNGDGFADLIIGAPRASPTGAAQAGATYVVFGRANFSSSLPLSTLDGRTGFRIDGIDAGDFAGFSVAAAGDVNGDGFQDLIIGAYAADPNGTSSGESYVIFGKKTGFAPSLPLSALNGTNGFRINGIKLGDASGRAVSGAGDVNGDGFDDVIIGAYLADPSGRTSAGESYVVFGHSGSFTPSFELSSLNGTNGFRIAGVAADDKSGVSVSSAGDINGDGMADLIIGATPTNGKAYVVLGSKTFASTVQLSGLVGNNGFRIDGDSGLTGKSVGRAGDINADGYDDLIVGDPYSDPSFRTDAGACYVIYGKGGGFSSTISVAALDGTNGLKILGSEFRGGAAYSISGAGDVNGDGFSDLIIGGWRSEPGFKTEAGRTYIVFGGDFRGEASSIGVDATGTTSREILVGSANNNTLTGKGGGDSLSGGAGNDLLTISDAFAFRKVSGGSGFDTLKLEGTAQFVDFRELADSRITGIEQIDLTSVRASLYFGLADILRLSDTSNTLRILATPDDTVFIGTGWTFKGTEMQEGRSFSVYTQGEATVLVGGQVELSGLQSGDGSTGFVIQAAHPSDIAGRAVNGIGDLNGDGYEDLIIGAPQADANGASNSGEAYVVFGKPGGFAPNLDLSTLNGTNGFTLFSPRAGDAVGTAVSGAGDFNGDGLTDLVVSAMMADPAGLNAAGEVYVVFGSRSAFPSRLDLTQLNGSTGFAIRGIAAGDRIGLSVDSAGDVNGDGFDDIVLGTPYPNNFTGQSYVIFGRETSPAVLELSALDGKNGFAMSGIDPDDFAGVQVSGAGDVNGDGFADVIVGASRANRTLGEAYVVFGKQSAFAANINLASLDGSNGFLIPGIDGYAGSSVGSAGDLNGDGFDDVIISAPKRASAGGFRSGESYVIFGRTNFAGQVDLATLNGTTGFTIDAVASDDYTGSVHSAGDVNGDGYDDLLIGSSSADAGGRKNAGQAYLVFGHGGDFAARLRLSSLDGKTGFLINGVDAYDRMGTIGRAGDINGDGFDDVILGARGAALSGVNYSGEAYVLFGRDFTGIVTHPGSTSPDVLTGNASNNVIVGGRGGDVLNSGGGADVLIGGEGNDLFLVTDGTFSRINGGTGTDKLQLVGSGLTLDLRNLADNALYGIEQIDIAGPGHNTLLLNLHEVLSISGESNTLVVRHDPGDPVDIGTGWTATGTEIISGESFTVYTQGAATLKLGGPAFTVFTVTNTSDSGPGSLRQALLDANADPGRDLISFNIDGATKTISPVTPLPAITEAVVIDATTQPGYVAAPIVEINGAGAGNEASGLVVLGGNSVIRGLLINGFSKHGVELSGGGGNVIEGNRIGIASNGVDSSGNGGDGIHVVSGNGNHLGGTAPGTANVIAFNSGSGVAILSGEGNSVLGNAIYHNQALGLDLGGDGVTANDAGDADTGANQLQNFPVLTAITSSGGTSTVHGTLKGLPGLSYRVEVFTSLSGDPSGDGEGETYLGFVEVVTDANGSAAFSVPVSSSPGAIVTATATDPTGNTSEFSAPFLPSIAVEPVTILEGNNGPGTAIFNVSLSGASNQPVTVNFTTKDGTAVAGSDYTALSGILTFAPGETTKTIAIEIVGDMADEAHEEFSILLSGVNNATLAQDSVTATLLNDDSTLQIQDVVALEGNTAASTMTFVVTLTQPNTLPVTVNFGAVDITAVNGSDYNLAPGVLNFAPGEVSKTITVEVPGDTDIEAHESFSLLLSGATNTKVGNNSATGTILNDDTAIRVNNVSQLEGHTGSSNGIFVVSLERPSALPVTVNFATGDVTALAGSDYVALTPGTLTFAPGETSKTLTVEILGDMAVESTESFSVHLSDATNATLAVDTGIGTILNDDVTIVGKKKATFTDVDGDLVTISVSKGTLSAANFAVVPSGVGSQLALVDFHGNTAFQAAKLSIQAKRKPGGDGFVDVGYIDAAGLDLAAVTVKGDLGRIDAGNAVTRTPGLSKLAAVSLGHLGIDTQLPDGSLQSNIAGAVKTLTVSQGIYDATLNVTGGADGTVRKVAVGKEIRNGKILTTGDIGSIQVKGDFVNAFIEAGSIHTISVKGSITGGAIRSDAVIGGLKVSGDISGGESGSVTISAQGIIGAKNQRLATAIGSISVGGTVDHAQILAGYNRSGVLKNGAGSIGPVNVGANWVASNLVAGASAGADGKFGTGDDWLLESAPSFAARIAAIVIKGSSIGTIGGDDHFGFVAGEIGSFRSGGAKLPLTKGAANDLTGLLAGLTGDVRVKEVILGTSAESNSTKLDS